MRFFLSCLSFGSGGSCFRAGSGLAIDGVQLALDLPVDIAPGEFSGNTNRILDSVSVGDAVADEGDAAHSQQGRAAEFRIVEPFLEIVEGTAGEQKSELARDRSIQRFLQHHAYGLHQAFGDLQRHIAHKTVAHDHIEAASAGRSTPGRAPRTIFAVAMAAPVWPAVTNPCARPSRTSRNPTRKEESRLERIDWAAFSRMPMTSLACTTSMGKSAALRWE